MDLSERELNLQREAFLRFEQQRKDEEEARRLQQAYYAQGRAEATVASNEVAEILDDEPEVVYERVRSPRRPIGRRVTRRVSTPARNRSRVSATTANRQDSLRRRLERELLENDFGPRIAVRPRMTVELEENSQRQQITISIRGPETSHSSTDEGENGERLGGRLFMNLFNELLGNPPSSRAGLRTLERLSPSRTTIRDPQYGECTLCMDDPCDPSGCNKCKQLIGCKDCVNTWYVTAMRSDNIPTCPLCRCEWSNRPDVRAMRFIAAEQRRAHLRRPAARRGNSAKQ